MPASLAACTSVLPGAASISWPSTVTVTVTEVNEIPVLGSLDAGTLAYAEGDGAVAMDADATVTDGDSADFDT